MIVFFEASALTSVYVRDTRTERVGSLFARERVVIASLSLVEVHSGISRARRNRRLTRAGLERAATAFDRDWVHFYQVPMSTDVVHRAVALVRETTLKAGDALQVAAYLHFQQTVPGVPFVNADWKIHVAVEQLGIPLIDVR